MQRAAASNAQDGSPKSGKAPKTPNSAEPPSKKRRVSGPDAGTNDSPSATSDLEAMRVAIAAENAKRDAVLERKAVEAGDRWVLDFASEPVPQTATDDGHWRVRSVGFAEIDGDTLAKRVAGQDWSEGADESDEDVGGGRGRMVFGKYKSKHTKGDSEDDSGSEEGSSDDDPDGAEERRARKRQKKEDARRRDVERLAKERRAKAVNLNKLTSISGGGAAGPGQNKSIKCHRCGQIGHIQSKCPKGRR